MRNYSLAIKIDLYKKMVRNIAVSLAEKRYSLGRIPALGSCFSASSAKLRDRSRARCQCLVHVHRRRMRKQKRKANTRSVTQPQLVTETQLAALSRGNYQNAV
jgi:hypothetical protein